ncbi:MAG TPA: biotin/lipoyl-binding protein, partial [Noviherbaspirillum sp.]|nr:biotin/lipoyl-binding protein [Noviherbaspirillum sp.]
RASEDDLPSQDEIITMISQLTDAGFLLFDTVPDWSALKQQQQVQRSREHRSNLNPFSFRVRLFNPAGLVDRLARVQPILWHPATAALAVALIGWALFHAALEWSAIRAYAAVNLLTPRCLLLAWLVYPVMKAFHELSHALAVRHWGGEVKDAGVGFFLLMPVPYVDASDAIAFPGKWQRVAVSSAGIAVELLLAGLALLIWMAAENGIVRDTAFVVMTVGGMSTIVFNANPLLRFDGYYILCDLIELPNLASRSQRWWTHQLQRYARKDAHDPEMQVQGREKFWLLLYAPASWGYRIFISVVIVQWVAMKSLFIAFIAMLWLFFSLFVKPVWNTIRLMFFPAQPGTQEWKPLVGAGCATAVLVAFLLGVPVPASTVADGVVWLPEQSQVRADSDGRIVEVLARDGQQVAKGQPLVILDSPALLARRARLHAQLMGAETEQATGWLNGTVQGRNAHENTDRLRQDLAQLDERIDKLTLRAGVDGVFVQPRLDDMLGRDISQGTLVAYVLADDLTTVRVAITQDDVGRLNSSIKNVSVRLAESGTKAFDASVVRADPAATIRLPSKALGDKGGGGLVTDPADREGLTLLEPVFLVDVQLADRKVVRTGGRAWVRFEHEAMPLAETALWRFRQLFLRLFSAKGA